MIKKIAAFQIPLLLILLLTLSATAPAIAQGPPAMPNQFYGTVTLNGSTAPSGTTVAVYVSGAPVASVNVDSQGKYGFILNGGNYTFRFVKAGYARQIE